MFFIGVGAVGWGMDSSFHLPCLLEVFAFL